MDGVEEIDSHAVASEDWDVGTVFCTLCTSDSDHGHRSCHVQRTKLITNALCKANLSVRKA